MVILVVVLVDTAIARRYYNTTTINPRITIQTVMAPRPDFATKDDLGHRLPL